MKKMSKTVGIFILGVVASFAINVAAEAVISSGAVSYSNAATAETTVSGALDELFSAVDINNKIGTTDISAIGDGTITGAISTVNEELDNLEIKNNTLFQNVTSLVYVAYQNRIAIINSRGEDVAKLINAIIPEGYRPNVDVIIPCYLSQISSPYVKAFGFIKVTPSGVISCIKIENYNTNAPVTITSDYEVYFSASYYI